MTATKAISSYVVRDTTNMDRYLQMIENCVWPTVSGWDNIGNRIFKVDGSLSHFALTARLWLEQPFLGRWMGRHGPHEGPPRGPDLTPSEFYLWS